MAECDGVSPNALKGCAARFTRRRLKAEFLFFYFYFYRFEGNSKIKAERRTKSLPIASVRAQSVIDVDRGKPVADLGGKCMQDMQ